jgi:hypothetical protein
VVRLVLPRPPRSYPLFRLHCFHSDPAFPSPSHGMPPLGALDALSTRSTRRAHFLHHHPDPPFYDCWLVDQIARIFRFGPPSLLCRLLPFQSWRTGWQRPVARQLPEAGKPSQIWWRWLGRAMGKVLAYVTGSTKFWSTPLRKHLPFAHHVELLCQRQARLTEGFQQVLVPAGSHEDKGLWL